MGTKSKKKAKTRLDAYYRMAKDQGFRSRAAYKLIQLNKKYDFLARSKVVVDLCAAPGGWCQVAAQYMPVGSKIVGVDLVPIAPIRGVKTFVGDITDDKTRKTIKTWLKKEPVDCVIHDGAPNVGGVWAKDLFAQNALVLCAAKMACDLLKPGGWFVTKVFRSPDYQKLLWVMKQLFEKVEATKPLASRMESAEIFVTCAGYKAPKNLDARLFQTQHVFADVGEEKIMTPSGLLVMPRNNVPQGYDEFATILSRTATLSQYLDCEDPKEFLKKYHEIRFETEEERALHRSRWSKPELVILCQDLQQVSDGDKRRLLRWREQLQRERATRRLNEAPAVTAASADGAAKPKKQAAEGNEGSDEDGSDDDEYSDVSSDGGAVLDEDAAVGDDLDAMTKQLLEIRRAREKEKKRKQKKMVDRKLKKVRGLINYDPTESAHAPTEMTEGVSKRLGDDEVDDSTDEGSDGELEGNDADWSIADLAKVPEKQVAKLFDKNFQEDDNNGLNVPLNAITDVLINPDDEMEVGSQDEFDAHDKLLEEGGEDGELDVDFHGNYVPNAKVAERVSFFDTPGVGSDEDEEDAAPAAKQTKLTAEEKKQKRLEKNAEKLDEVGKQSKWQRRHLNVEQVLRETFPKASAAGKAGKRRGRTEEDLVEMGDGAGSTAKGASSRALTREALRQGRLHDESDGSSDDEDDDISSLEAALAESDDERGSDDDGAKIVAGRGKQRGKMQVLVPDAAKLTAMEQVKAQRKQLKKDNKKNKAAAKKNKKDDTSFEEIPLAMTDPDVRARTLALATKMLDKRARKEILDGSINRYMHNDDEEMPDWFIKDEQRNNKIYMPVTAAEIDAQRRRFQEMNLRPGKKVMEAMGRKRRKAQRMLRGLLDKGKTDPSVRNKVQGLSVRKLMRSKAVKGPGIQKKKEPLDNKRRGEKRREKQKAKRAGKGGR